jgi:hypothetical protein
MLDLIVIISLALLFGLALAYVQGCARLKGDRP